MQRCCHLESHYYYYYYYYYYLDDGTIGGSPESLTADLRTIEEKGQELGLCLNVMKSELICTDRSAMQSFLLEFPGLQLMSPNEVLLLGSFWVMVP